MPQLTVRQETHLLSMVKTHMHPLMPSGRNFRSHAQTNFLFNHEEKKGYQFLNLKSNKTRVSNHLISKVEDGTSILVVQFPYVPGLLEHSMTLSSVNTGRGSSSSFSYLCGRRELETRAPIINDCCRFTYKVEDRIVITHLMPFLEDDPGTFVWSSNILQGHLIPNC